MSKGNLESITRVANWLKSMHVKGRFIGLAMLKAGVGVFERKNKELDEIFEYLESNGVRKEWMGCVLSRCPQLLSYTFEEIKTRVGFYKDMGMNDGDFGTMVFDYPRVLGYFTLTEMIEKVVHTLSAFFLSLFRGLFHFLEYLVVFFYQLMYSSNAVAVSTSFETSTCLLSVLNYHCGRYGV